LFFVASLVQSTPALAQEEKAESSGRAVIR